MSRFRASRVTTGWLPKDATKIGRAVIMTSTRALHPIQRQLDQLQGRGIDPVRVLDHPQHGPTAGEPGQLIDEDGERAAAALLRRQHERAVPDRRVETHERRHQGRGLADIVGSPGEQCLESSSRRSSLSSAAKPAA